MAKIVRASRNGPITRTDPSEDEWVRMAVAYLSIKDRSVREVAQYLARRGAPETTVQQVVQRCREWGYLDDRAYAGRWAEARLTRYPMGRLRLEAELLAKGLDEHDLAEVVDRLYSERSERVRAGELVATLQRAGRGAIGRLSRTLRQRGFSEDTIEDVLRPMADDATA